MANIFTITTPTQTLKADASGAATTVFTVTNTTSRPVRGIAKVKPLGNTEAQWLMIDGEAERDFPAGGTHQFTVNFNKPKPATPPAPPSAPQPAEFFPFRLDAISTTNPDEDFAEGQVVTVEIAERKAAPKKSFPWWILIIVGVLVIGTIAAVFLLRDKGTDDNENTATPTATGTPAVTPTRTTSIPTPIMPTPSKTRPKIVRMAPKEYGKDRPGSDFQYFVAPSLQDCENACRENAACKAFTFGNGSNCWLKNAKPAPVNNPNFISGIKIE